MPVVVGAQGSATVSHSQPALQVQKGADPPPAPVVQMLYNLFSPLPRFSQLLVTDVMSQPLASASVLVESASAASSKSVALSRAPFTLNEYVRQQS